MGNACDNTARLFENTKVARLKWFAERWTRFEVKKNAEKFKVFAKWSRCFQGEKFPSADQADAQQMNTASSARRALELLTERGIKHSTLARNHIGVCYTQIWKMLNKPTPWDEYSDFQKNAYLKLLKWAISCEENK